MAVYTTMNRRGFLRSVGIAAAPMVVPSVVLGGETGRAPSDRITVGCIGVGNMGTGNLRGFLWASGVQVVAVCDVDRVRCDKAREMVKTHYAKKRESGTYSGCAAYSDFREIISRDDIDVVVVSTADHWHVLAALAGVRSGKDVYVEKPLSVTIEEGRVLSDAVRRYGRVLQMGSQQRSDQRFRLACELVRNGRIGEVKHVKVGLVKGKRMDVAPTMPVPKGFDYDMWLGPAPWAPYTRARCHYNFRFISDYSGGQMLNWGSHYLDIAQWGLGTDRSGPVEVRGKGEYPKDGLFNNPVTYEVDYRYASGITLNCSTSNRIGTRFEGTDGWVYVSRGKIDAHPKSLLRSVILPDEIHLYRSRSHRANFLECVRSRAETITPVEVGHRSATMGHMGNIAMLLERPLRWNPELERFVDDPEADRLISRGMRGPWRLW